MHLSGLRLLGRLGLHTFHAPGHHRDDHRDDHRHWPAILHGHCRWAVESPHNTTSLNLNVSRESDSQNGQKTFR